MLRVLSDALTAADNRAGDAAAGYARFVGSLRLRRPFDFTTTIAAELWSNWCCLTVVDIVLVWPSTADDLQRSAL